MFFPLKGILIHWNQRQLNMQDIVKRESSNTSWKEDYLLLHPKDTNLKAEKTFKMQGYRYSSSQLERQSLTYS